MSACVHYMAILFYATSIVLVFVSRVVFRYNEGHDKEILKVL